MNTKIVALCAVFVLLFGCAFCAQSCDGEGNSNPTQAPTQAPTHKATQAPTHAPTHAATQAPTHKATQAPTQAPTHAATQAPTHAPTQHATNPPTQTTGTTTTNLCAVTPTSSEPLKVLVPLYVDPGSAWDELITAANSGVPIIAIINPNSGPDSSGPDSSYVTYMQKLTTAGIEMLGYVHTSYGDRSISDVTTDINTYATKYTGLKGIFIDEASASASEISYYTQVYNAVTSHSGYANVILNPGTQPDQGYLAISTNIMIFEDTGAHWSSSSSSFASWVKCAPSASAKAGYKYKFSSIAYATASSSVSSIISSMANAGVGMVYLTDGASGCCTYNTLASYFSTEASTVSSLN